MFLKNGAQCEYAEIMNPKTNFFYLLFIYIFYIKFSLTWIFVIVTVGFTGSVHLSNPQAKEKKGEGGWMWDHKQNPLG